MRMWKFILTVVAIITTGTPAFAWDPQGHKLVGAIADELLTPNAKQQVQKFLGFPLQIAAPWPDCVRSIVHKYDPQPKGSFDYLPSPLHPEYRLPCLLFEGNAELKRMKDYVEANPGNASYHFADVPIQRGRYDRNYAGTGDQDVVSAINAAIAKLKGQPVPKPFFIKDEKEALFLLAHFVGDIHQPLHVGAVYLDANGKLVDPEDKNVDPSTETHGGNAIQDGADNLHSEWDEIPEAWGPPPPDAEILAAARKIAATPTPGAIEGWAATWASESVTVARDAFAGLTFSGAPDHKWNVNFANNDKKKYEENANRIKRDQLAKGGARLAQVLNTIWP
jgi:S1/P1 nuclease